MNREIKFRVWDKDNKYWYHSPQLVIRPYSGKVTDGATTPNVELSQFTGLKDKNGKEIYEGDIIEKTYYSYHQPECSEIFKIIYNGLGFSFEHIKGCFYHTPFTEEIEVIGNIYDNPELLEAV